MAKRKDYLGRSLAVSLALHVALLSLQFGVPGMGLPWPGLALNERKASIPTVKAVLRSGQERAVVVQSKIRPVPAAEVRRPAPEKLKHREPRVKKRATGKKQPKPVPALQPALIVPVPAPVPAAAVPMAARIETVKESAAPQVDREEIVKPVVKVEKQKTQSDGSAVLSTEKESSWQLNTVSPNTVTSEVQAEAQKEQIAREAKVREQQMAEEQEAQREKAQAQTLAAKKAEERERASKEEAAAALEKAQAEAQKNEERAAMEKTQAAALERKREEALLQAAADDKRKQEQMTLAKEREETERMAKVAALAREDEVRRKEEQAALAKAQEDAREKKKAEALAAEEKRKEEQAALAKAKEDALAKAVQAEARAREQAAAAAASAANAANAAAEMNRAAERGARNSASTVDGKAEGNKQGGAQVKGVDLARRAMDMARSGLPGLPVKSPVEAERPRRGSILGRNPSDIQLAFYGEGWTQKIERIASVNYPKLNRNTFYGSLVLSVSINSDGSVAARRIVKTSGNKELDEAVLRIVDMCSPFAAFPPDLKRNYDVVEVTRTLSFPEKPPVIISQ